MTHLAHSLFRVHGGKEGKGTQDNIDSGVAKERESLDVCLSYLIQDVCLCVEPRRALGDVGVDILPLVGLGSQ